MKKTLTLFLFTFILNLAISQEKNYKILFSAEYISEIKPKINENQISEEEKLKKEIQNKYIEKYSSIELELLFTSKKAIFRNVDKIKPEQDMYYELALNKVTGGKVYYYDLELNEKMFRCNLIGETFTVNLPTNKLEWTITNETKTINDFNCIKATTFKIIPASVFNPEKKIPIEAWFTPDIMGSFGPCGFDGLPGVILSIYFNNIHVFATSISIEKKQEITKPLGKTHFENEEAFNAEILKILNKKKNEQ